jgi:hypothetical protein
MATVLLPDLPLPVLSSNSWYKNEYTSGLSRMARASVQASCDHGNSGWSQVGWWNKMIRPIINFRLFGDNV